MSWFSFGTRWVPVAIAQGADGNIWFANYQTANGNPGAIGRITPGSANVMCVVPRVVGLTLAAAKRALATAGCSVGTITKRQSKRSNRGRVI